MSKRRYVNVYALREKYGGPEEGGWYYTTGTPVLSIRCKRANEANRKHAQQWRKSKDLSTGRNRIVGGGDFPDHDVDPLDEYGVEFGTDFWVCIESHPGKPFPDRRPHYE